MVGVVVRVDRPAVLCRVARGLEPPEMLESLRSQDQYTVTAGLDVWAFGHLLFKLWNPKYIGYDTDRVRLLRLHADNGSNTQQVYDLLGAGCFALAFYQLSLSPIEAM